MSTNSTYDYVIIGGGTAGLVLASRLSEDSHVSVAVIEAGGHGDDDPRVATPGLFTALQGSERDWNFGTTPQKGLNGRRIGQSQGKVMGGTSSLNGLVLIPPSRADLDAWEKLGNPGWAWKLMAPYITKPFTVSLPDEETTKHLSITWAEKLADDSNGPVKASFPDVKQNPIGKAWVETWEAMGYPLTDNPFTGSSLGAYNAAATINSETKTRTSSSTGYYQPAATRPNLKVFTNSVVQKVILENGIEGEEPRAAGVQVIQQGATSTVLASKEVILSAGVFNSPKILELSGIGDPEILKSQNISVQVANPFVGSNLQDHVLCGISFEAQDGIYTVDDMMRKDQAAIASAMEQYQTNKAGPFSTGGITCFGYLPTVDFTSHPEELDITLKTLSEDTSSHPLDLARRDILRNLLLETGKGGTAQYCLFLAQSTRAGVDTIGGINYEAQPGNFITIVAALSHPLSTGSSHISSSDINAPPTIDHQYLTHPLDLDLHARHVRYIETLAATPPFSSTLLKKNGRRNDPTAFLNGDLEKAKSFVKSSSTTNWHSCGTCAMAPKDKGGVVDPKLRVYGVKGLRVVDASVFPFLPQSNTQSLVYAVAERASDIIKGN